jgi:hypothetical protein
MDRISVAQDTAQCHISVNTDKIKIIHTEH